MLVSNTVINLQDDGVYNSLKHTPQTCKSKKLLIFAYFSESEIYALIARCSKNCSASNKLRFVYAILFLVLLYMNLNRRSNEL
jgi:hypothetical protein